MKCKNRRCNRLIPEDAKYCPYCGKSQAPKQVKHKRPNGTGSIYKRSNVISTPYVAVTPAKYAGAYKEKGQIIGITGAVACGKSTLGKAFLCEYPYEGHITVDGAELQNMEQSVRTGIVGYLGHDPELFNDSVENNVLLGDSKNSDTYLNAACMKQEVAEMTDGKNTLIGSGGAYLSGGQAKRLAFARTLCHDKPILILDDPFSALDKNTEKQAFVNLQALAKDSIVLLISHRLYLFPEMDGVIWMENGKAVTGTHEELLKIVPEYENLYRSQVHTTENGGAEHDAQKTSENGDL